MSEGYNGEVCCGCNRWRVLCDADPVPCEHCDCPDVDEVPPEWRWWFNVYYYLGTP